uniref:Uncharacterized protein n=1 Tax=Hucho hucho TaxID=62062 RepID=A0A4W5L9E8_9TELE
MKRSELRAGLVCPVCEQGLRDPVLFNCGHSVQTVHQQLQGPAWFIRRPCLSSVWKETQNNS